MRPKSIALLLLALGCGLVASIGITEVMAKRNAQRAAPSGETQPIFVAMTDIGLGDLLTPEVLKLEQWPKDKVPAGAISRIEDVEGRRTRTRLYTDEPILENRLLGRGASEQGATALIPKGYRVVPVKVDLVSGGSSLILPGDRVDVMVHLVRDMGRDIPETVTRTILQDIKVFAVNDVVELEKDKGTGRTIAAKTISLLVTPEQAAKVMLATQLGTINLVMRSSEDDEQIPNAQARPRELFGTTSKSDRDKEDARDQSQPDLHEKTKGFLDFLNAMKSRTPTPVKPTASETWSMRVLKPGDVEELQFKAEDTQASQDTPFGAWKTTANAVDNPKPAKIEPEILTPQAKQPSAKDLLQFGPMPLDDQDAQQQPPTFTE